MERYDDMEVEVKETTVTPDDAVEETTEAPVEEVAEDTPVGDASGNVETNEFATSGMGKPNQIYDELGKTADRSVHNDPEAEKSIIDSVEPQLKELEEGLAFDKHESEDFTSNIKVGAGANGGLQLDNQEETSAYREIVERDAKINRTEVLDLGKGDSTTEAFAKAMDQETEGKGFLADSANKNETAIISDSEQKPDMYGLYKDKKMDYTVEDRETGEMEQAGAQSNEKFNDPELMTPKDEDVSEPMEADVPETAEEVEDPEVESNNPGTTEDEVEVNEDEEDLGGTESEEEDFADEEAVEPEEESAEEVEEEPSEEVSAADEMESEDAPAEGGSGDSIQAEVIHDNREEEDQEETVTATLGGSSDLFENSDQARSLNEPDKDTEKEIVPPNESQPAENNAEEVNEPECQGEIGDGQTLGEVLNPEERVNPEDRSNDQSYDEQADGDVYEGHSEVESDEEVVESDDTEEDKPEVDDATEAEAPEEEVEEEEETEEGAESYEGQFTRFDQYNVPEGGVEAHLLELLKEF